MLNWNVYRRNALFFVLLAPFGVLAAVLIWAFFFKPIKTKSRPLFWIAAFAQAIGYAFGLSFWLHLVPCITLDCDLGPGDDASLRGGLWFGGWFVFFLLFVYPFALNKPYGLVKLVK